MGTTSVALIEPVMAALHYAEEGAKATPVMIVMADSGKGHNQPTQPDIVSQGGDKSETKESIMS